MASLERYPHNSKIRRKKPENDTKPSSDTIFPLFCGWGMCSLCKMVSFDSVTNDKFGQPREPDTTNHNYITINLSKF